MGVRPFAGPRPPEPRTGPRSRAWDWTAVPESVWRTGRRPVVAGQHAVYVTVAVEGQGHASASQLVTLDVLGPDTGTDSTNVTISC